MAGFVNAVSACFVLLLLMSVGYFMGARGWMTASEKKFLSKFIINIAVPCNCVVGLLNNLDRAGVLSADRMLLSNLLSVAATILLCMGAARLLRLPRERWGVFVAMAALSNTLFIGLPVSTQLFGEVCVPYVMLYYFCNTSFVQSVGLLLIERSGDGAGKKLTLSGLLRDMLTKPPILALLLSLALLLLDLRLPGPVMRFADYVGDAVTPLALAYSGFIVYEVGLKELRLLRGLPTMLVFRLAVSPLICLACCTLFGVTGLARDVFLVESALPVVSQVPVMAGAFGADERYAATGACLSILCSFVTIPVLMLILG